MSDSIHAVVRQESATDFMLRKAHDFNEWLTIGDPRTMARIRECIRRYPKSDARHALRATCMSNARPHAEARSADSVQADVGLPSTATTRIYDHIQGSSTMAQWECIACGHRWCAAIVLPCDQCQPNASLDGRRTKEDENGK